METEKKSVSQIVAEHHERLEFEKKVIEVLSRVINEMAKDGRYEAGDLWDLLDYLDNKSN